MKSDRRWWNDGAWERTIQAQKSRPDQDEVRRLLSIEAKLLEIGDAVLALMEAIRGLATPEVRGFAPKAVVVIEGFDGTVGLDGRLGTLLGVVSEHDNDDTRRILEGAALSEGRRNRQRTP